MKWLLVLVLPAALVACGAGKYPLDDSSADDYGSLESYAFATNFATANLADNVLTNICLPGTSDANCARNQANLASDFQFKLQQISQLTSKVAAYRIEYNTPGGLNENRRVSGAVLIPNLPGQQIRGLVLYFHSTSFAKASVPSCLNNDHQAPGYCSGHTTAEGDELAAILAAQGYIVVAPDYVGLGLDDKVIHPYILYPTLNGLSGLYMLKAVRSLLTQINFPLDQKNLYLIGYSEGGSYALEASRLVQTLNTNWLSTLGLKLAGTVAISGAYDVSHAQLAMATENVKLGDKFNIASELTATLAKPVLVAYLLSSYGFYHLNQEYSSLMVAGFYNCLSCFISGRQYTIPQLFNDPLLDDGAIENYVSSAAMVTGYGINGNNSAKALIKTELFDSLLFQVTVSSADVSRWQTATPVTLIYLSKDSLVTNLNSVNAYYALKAAAPADLVRAVVIDNTADSGRYYYHNQISNQDEPIDHLQSAYPSLIAALAQIVATKN